MDHDAVDVFLEHHGIKGMKWGVRRNREVSADKQAHREAKAQKYVKRSADLQTKISELQAKPRQTYVQRYLTEGNRQVRISELQREKATADKAAEAKRQGHLTDTQKKVLIGTAATAAILGTAYLGVKINSGEARVFMNRGKEVISGKKFEYIKAPELKGNWDPENINSLVAKEINTGYGKEFGANMNCRRCTFAYEMRRRGYDVVATKTPNGSGQTPAGLLNAITTDYHDVSNREFLKRILGQAGKRASDSSEPIKDPITRHLTTMLDRSGSLRSFDDPANIFSRLALEPERSRGELGVFWAGGGGHSMAYEVIHGHAYIFDTQSGRYFKNMNELTENLPEMARAGFTRLDDVPLDQHFLQRWLKNAK